MRQTDHKNGSEEAQACTGIYISHIYLIAKNEF